MLPVREAGGSYFVQEIDQLQPVFLDLRAQPVSMAGEDATEMEVDLELRFRNRASEPRQAQFFVASEGQVDSWRGASLGGRALEVSEVSLQYDPNHPEFTAKPGYLIKFELPASDVVVLRLQLRVGVVQDSIGQRFITLPFEAFKLWEDQIDAAVIDIDFGDRALGLQMSLTHGVVYPEGRLRWFVRDWSPVRALQVSWVGAWQALTLVTELEECPRPWDLAAKLSEGLPELQEWLSGWDSAALSFCGSLPLVIRGHYFPSERVRRELASIPMNRYLGTSGDRGALYVPDRAFELEELSEIERVYHRVLLNASERSAGDE